MKMAYRTKRAYSVGIDDVPGSIKGRNKQKKEEENSEKQDISKEQKRTKGQKKELVRKKKSVGLTMLCDSKNVSFKTPV